MDDNQNNLIKYDDDKTDKCDSSVPYCVHCEMKFRNIDDLNQHSLLHNESKQFTCLLCNEVFTDVEQLKLHDLRHSLEEAEETATDVENLIVPSASVPCEICGKVFSCDEELIDHCVIHTELEKLSSYKLKKHPNDELSSDSSECSDSEEEKPINYRILRQKVLQSKTGNTHIRLTLTDHVNSKVEEFTYILPGKNVKKSQKNLESRGKPKFDSRQSKDELKSFKKKAVHGLKAKKIKTNSKKFGDKFKIKSKCNLSLKQNVSKKSPPVKSEKPKVYVPKYQVQNGDLSPDSEVEILPSASELESLLETDDVGENKRNFRRSKLVAMKKKIWKFSPEYFHRDKATTVCKFCQKKFPSSSKLERHMNTHRNKLKKLPSKLETSVQRRTPLPGHGKPVVQHIVNSSGVTEIVYACDNCKRVFKSTGNYAIHDCSVSSKYVCVVCQYKFTKPYHLKRHLENVHKLKEYTVQAYIRSAREAVGESCTPIVKKAKKSSTLNKNKKKKSIGEEIEDSKIHDTSEDEPLVNVTESEDSRRISDDDDLNLSDNDKKNISPVKMESEDFQSISKDVDKKPNISSDSKVKLEDIESSSDNDKKMNYRVKLEDNDLQSNARITVKEQKSPIESDSDDEDGFKDNDKIADSTETPLRSSKRLKDIAEEIICISEDEDEIIVLDKKPSLIEEISSTTPRKRGRPRLERPLPSDIRKSTNASFKSKKENSSSPSNNKLKSPAQKRTSSTSRFQAGRPSKTSETIRKMNSLRGKTQTATKSPTKIQKKLTKSSDSSVKSKSPVLKKKAASLLKKSKVIASVTKKTTKVFLSKTARKTSTVKHSKKVSVKYTTKSDSKKSLSPKSIKKLVAQKQAKLNSKKSEKSSPVKNSPKSKINGAKKRKIEPPKKCRR